MTRTAIAVLWLALVMSGADKKVIFPPGARPAGPYSPGILAGGFLFVSGQGAKGPDGRFPADPAAQVRQCLRNVKSVLDASGMQMDQVAYVQVYVPEPWNYRVIDPVWQEFFASKGPARAILGVSRLPEDTPVEMNAIASAGPLERIGSSAAPQAVKTSGLIFVSGVTGPDAEAALHGMEAALQAAGAGMRNLVFVNPYLTSAVSYQEMNRAYAPHFEFGNTPARATIEVASLESGAVEFTGIAVADLARRRAVRPKNMEPSPTASPCVFAGDLFFCSAKSAFIPGPNSGIYAETVGEQVRMSFRNLLDGLEEAGLTLANVVAANVYLDDIADFPLMNDVYRTFFAADPPSRTTLQPLAPVKERRPGANGHWPALEQISFVAVK